MAMSIPIRIAIFNKEKRFYEIVLECTKLISELKIKGICKHAELCCLTAASSLLIVVDYAVIILIEGIHEFLEKGGTGQAIMG